MFLPGGRKWKNFLSCHTSTIATVYWQEPKKVILTILFVCLCLLVFFLCISLCVTHSLCLHFFPSIYFTLTLFIIHMLCHCFIFFLLSVVFSPPCFLNLQHCPDTATCIANMEKNPASVGCKKEWHNFSAFANDSLFIIDVCAEEREELQRLIYDREWGDSLVGVTLFVLSFNNHWRRNDAEGFDVICRRDRNH